jgi:hypothetical protein
MTMIVVVVTDDDDDGGDVEGEAEEEKTELVSTSIF